MRYKNGARLEKHSQNPIGQRRDRERVGQSGKKWGKVSKNTRMGKNRDYQRV
jgi:hypothetical protein